MFRSSAPKCLAARPKWPIAIGRTVSNPKVGRRRSPPRPRYQEETVLKEIVAIADRDDYEIATTMQAGVAPEKAITNVAERRDHNLISMGVSRGDTFDFGDTAAAVLNTANSLTLFIST